MSTQDVLWGMAVEQYGYVTTQNARDAGIAPVVVRQLVHRHQLESAAHGVYRFPQIPVTEYDRYMLAVLWTGKAAARLGHETALANYEVCDINPNRIHLCLPRTVRIRRQGSDLYVLHYEDLVVADEAWWQKVPTVTLNTAIRQCIDSKVPSYLIRQAVENGGHKGLLLSSEVDVLNERLSQRNE